MDFFLVNSSSFQLRGKYLPAQIRFMPVGCSLTYMYLLCWTWLIIKVFPFASLGNERVLLSLHSFVVNNP